MRTLLIKINAARPEKRKMRAVARILRRGGIVVFPTETVYGIGANALNGEACRKIFRVKRRAADNPLIVHVSSLEMARRVCDIPSKYQKVISDIWPAPLTIITKSKSILPKVVTAGLETAAVRMPANRIALELINECGFPIAAPSANISTKPSATSALHALGYFKGKVAAIIDGGNASYGIESTVLDLRTFSILRPGAFTAEEIKKSFGKSPRIASAYKLKANSAPISPGTKYKHYAPSTPLFLYVGRRGKIGSILSNIDDKFAFIGSSASSEKMGKNVIRIDIGSSKKEIARNLFDSLIKLDYTGANFAVVEQQSSEGLGLAIRNRLLKASSNRAFKTAKELKKLILLYSIKD